MKLFSRLLMIALVASMIASCESDDPVVTNPPIVSITAPPANTTVNAGSWIEFSISATAGENPMNDVEILEDGLKIADYANRITINGSAASSNPILLFDDERNELSWIVGIKVQDDASTRTYSVRINDDKGGSDNVSVDITTSSGPLTLSMTSGTCFVTDATIDINSWFCVELIASKGAFSLATLSVMENGAPITDLTRISLQTAAAGNVAANPINIDVADQDGFTWKVYVKASNAGTNSYSYVLADVGSNTEMVGLSMTTGNAITTLTGVLLNQAGPAGTGGLDLNTGTGTGSADVAAEIRDEGIDIGQPNNLNWVQQISAVNGAVMRYADPAAENFDFDNITVDSEISAAFNSESIAFTATGFDSGNPASNTVQIGDVFLVRAADGTDFAIKVTNISVTDNDNSDSYTFDIKY